MNTAFLAYLAVVTAFAMVTVYRVTWRSLGQGDAGILAIAVGLYWPFLIVVSPVLLATWVVSRFAKR